MAPKKYQQVNKSVHVLLDCCSVCAVVEKQNKLKVAQVIEYIFTNADNCYYYCEIYNGSIYFDIHL